MTDAVLQMKTNRTEAATMPKILARMNAQRETGLDISSSTVPLRISRETVWLEEKTATNRPNSNVVAIELSTTSFNCSENTKSAIDGKWPISNTANNSSTPKIGSRIDSLNVLAAIL